MSHKCNNNKIWNRMGTQLYKADEETTDLANAFKAKGRHFTMNMYDNTGQSFLKFYRPNRDCCTGCSCWGEYIADRITCITSDGTTIAYIKEQDSQGFCWAIKSESYYMSHIFYFTLCNIDYVRIYNFRQ